MNAQDRTLQTVTGARFCLGRSFCGRQLSGLSGLLHATSGLQVMRGSGPDNQLIVEALREFAHPRKEAPKRRSSHSSLRLFGVWNVPYLAEFSVKPSDVQNLSAGLKSETICHFERLPSVH